MYIEDLQVAVKSLNLVLFTVDALRADQVSCISSSVKRTPNLDRLAKNGWVFKEAISSGPYTSPAIVSLFSSYCPGTLPNEITNATRTNPCHRFSAERPSFVDFLRHETYKTCAFVDSNPYASSYFGFGRGFDAFEDFMGVTGSTFYERSWQTLGDRAISWMSRHPTLRYLLPRKPIIGAEGINRLALSWIRRQKADFFLWVHYMDVHAPYIPPGTNLKAARWVGRRFFNHRKRMEDMPERDLGLLLGLYEEAVRYVDRNIGFFLSALESLGIDEDTYVIVTSDHGEEFGEHGSWGGHKAKLYDELIRVPLIISGPEIAERTVESQVSLSNLAPTILNLLGFPNPSEFNSRCHNLMDVVKAKGPAISEFYSRGRRGISYRQHSWKYIIRMPIERKGKIDEELYHLSYDPTEKENVIAEYPERTDFMRNQVKLHLEEEKRNRERLILKKKIRFMRNRNVI